MNYDFSLFHKDCGDGMRGVVVAPDGLHVYCLKCGVSANMEAIAGKIPPAEACKVNEKRQVTGKMSPNVDRGGLVL